MHNRFLLRNLTIFMVVTLFAVALQDTQNLEEYEKIRAMRNDDIDEPNLVREKRAGRAKQGFFRTLFSVAYEQYNDTKNTFNTVNNLINDNFLPENAPITTTTMNPDPNVSTTAAPYRITRTEFNRIIRRNLRGLVRLFNIELNDAIKQSDRNYREFKKNASIEVGKFL